jgi:hypothetical protein
MTYKEQWEKEHPGMSWIDEHSCPRDANNNPIKCLGLTKGSCIDCWNQEIPETAAEAELTNEPTPEWPKENPHISDNAKAAAARMAARLMSTRLEKAPEDDFTIIDIPHDGSYVEILGHRITGDFKTFEGFLEYLKDLEETKRKYEKLLAERHEAKNIPIPDGTDLNDIKNPGTYILDSGDRTEFATGAVRDMREGKGRCDLMPLEVVARLVGSEKSDDICNPDLIIGNIALFMEKEHNTLYLYRALNYFAQDRYVEYIHPITAMFLEVAKHFEEGAKKYGESNWQKGIPVHCYIDSAVRHYLKWLRGDKDEPHDRAFVWNLMCCIWEVDYHKEETHDR